MLGKLSVLRLPTNLDNRRAREPIALAVSADGGCLDIFFSRISFLFSFTLSGRRSDID